MENQITEETIQIGPTKIQLFKCGSGEPLLVLHGGGGNRPQLKYIQTLAEHFTVYLPSHPGFNGSDRPEWIESVQDLATFYNWFQEQEGLENVRGIGFSLGGWIAAEMATNCHHSFSKLMLVDPAGIKPEKSQITDIFIITPQQLLDLTFFNKNQASEYDQIYRQTTSPEERDTAEKNLETLVKTCWKPYMHDPRLNYLLERVKIPTRIVWGKQDQIIPLECGELYQKALKGSDLVVIDECGHAPQIEKPEEFSKVALEFLT